MVKVDAELRTTIVRLYVPATRQLPLGPGMRPLNVVQDVYSKSGYRRDIEIILNPD